MKRNTLDAYYAAYSWSKMDNAQRHEVVKLLEQEYGSDFAHKAKFGNQYCKPAVGVGKLLSKKKDLTKDAIGYYLNDLLDRIVTIRALVPLDLHLPVVRRSHNVGAPKFGVYAVNPSNGQSFAEVIFDTKEDAEKDKARRDELIDLSKIGGIREIREVDASAVEMYDVLEWNCEKQKYELSKEFPTHKDKKSAIDRASHNTRMVAAFCIQWEAWKSAGHKAPEDYDYFEKENILHFDKKDFLCSPVCYDYHLKETPYWSKLNVPEVDEAFLDFCSKL